MPDILKLTRESDLKPEPVNPAQRAGRIYRRILVGTDFTVASTPAFEQGLKLAKQNGAELLIAHSCAMPRSLSVMTGDSYDVWEKQCRSEAEGCIGPLIQKARKEGVKAHILVLSGLADDAIVEAAERLGVDLIAIGADKHRGISRFFFRSVAAQVVARAPCAVLIVCSCRQGPKSTRRR
jgi:nucleotide-binding universal stress UspA family protein